MSDAVDKSVNITSLCHVTAPVLVS